MDHAKVASEVLDALGGADNINAAAHCATRLRLVINDDGKIGLRVKMCVWLGVSRGLDLAFLNAD